MASFRFTLFNNLTLFLMALTAGAAVLRLRGRASSSWPLAYYAAALGYTFGFEGGLNPYGVFAGLISSLLVRLGIFPRQARVVELAALAYVLWRCLGLLLLWPPCAPFCAWGGNPALASAWPEVLLGRRRNRRGHHVAFIRAACQQKREGKQNPGKDFCPH